MDAARHQGNAKVIILAMINTAKADGTLAARNRSHHGQAGPERIGAESFQLFLLEQREDSLVPHRELEAQAYAASLFAAEVNTGAGGRYLRYLAYALDLED